MTSIVSTASDFLYQLYSYREYLQQSVTRDLRNKYKRSVLGYFWTVLHPLAMMLILALVFSHITRMPIRDYALFLFSGLLPWNYFQSSVLMSLGNIRHNARLFGQIPLPKYIFILSTNFSNLINLLLAIIPLILIAVITGHPIPLTALAFPLVLLPIFCVAVGVSLILATSAVFFDDTLHLAEVGLQALYFLSPVLYHRELLPPRLVKYLVLNPLFCQIEFVRGLFFEGRLPDPVTFLINLGASIAILLIGLMIFQRSEKKFLYFI